jgi:hypothetical protein
MPELRAANAWEGRHAIRFSGLDAAQFAPLFALGDEELASAGIRRVVADSKRGFPCRVTLEDAEPGERLLFLAFEHQPAHTPCRVGGPIFVRENARETFDCAGASPMVLSGRTLSVRAYAQNGMMVDADVAEGDPLKPLLERLFGCCETAYAHIHFAKRGCYACRVEREDTGRRCASGFTLRNAAANQ